MRDRTRRFATLLDEGSEVRITSPNGTDLRGSIRGRVTLPSYGVAEETFNHSSFPTGEAMLAPVEGTTNGVAVIDISMGGVGRLQQPVKLVVKDGRIVDVQGGDEARAVRRLIERAGPGGDNFAEFGFGTNHKGRPTGNKNEDKKIAGTAHVAIGNNYNFGGRAVPGLGGEVKANIHLDSVISNVTVWIDGQLVVKDGEVLI